MPGVSFFSFTQDFSTVLETFYLVFCADEIEELMKVKGADEGEGANEGKGADKSKGSDVGADEGEGYWESEDAYEGEVADVGACADVGECAEVGKGADEVKGARSEGADEGEGLGVKVLMKVNMQGLMLEIMNVKVITKVEVSMQAKVIVLKESSIMKVIK